jgi:hypothetical protein
MIYRHNDNEGGVTAVLCETRCGHTSMKAYFNTDIPSSNLGSTRLVNNILYNSIDDIEADRIVLVVRQPYDRLWSSKTHVDRVIAQGYIKSRLRDEWISDHSDLYLHKLCESGKITHIIPFQNLSDYIPVSTNTIQYNITHNHTKFEDWMYQYHSQDDMELEYSGYIKLLNTVPQFGIKNWQKYCA